MQGLIYSDLISTTIIVDIRYFLHFLSRFYEFQNFWIHLYWFLKIKLNFCFLNLYFFHYLNFFVSWSRLILKFSLFLDWSGIFLNIFLRLLSLLLFFKSLGLILLFLNFFLLIFCGLILLLRFVDLLLLFNLLTLSIIWLIIFLSIFDLWFFVFKTLIIRFFCLFLSILLLFLTFI